CEAAAAKPPKAAIHPAILEGCVTETIIGGPLLRILQRLVGFADFLELSFGFLVIRIPVRMIFHRQAAIGALQSGSVGTSVDAQHFVEISFGHHPARYQKCLPGINAGEVHPSRGHQADFFLSSSSSISSKSAS